MKSEWRYTVRTLRAVYWLAVLVALLVALLFETGTAAAGFLWCDDGGAREFVVVTICELATIVLLPSALFLFRIKRIRRALKAGGTATLLRLGLVRIAMIGVPLIADTLLYYGYMSVSPAYMALMSLVVMVFIYPSETRCREEAGEEELKVESSCSGKRTKSD